MPLDHDRLRRWLQIAVALFLLTLITHGSFSGSGDPIHYMIIARSIAFDRDLDVANDYGEPSALLQQGQLEAGAHAQQGRRGILRPVHDLGLPLLAAPYFAAAYVVAERLTDRLPEAFRRRARLDRWIMLRQLLSVGMIAVTLVLAGLFFDSSLAATGAPWASFVGALLWTLSPPVLSHSHVFFTEIPSALIALYVYRALRSDGGLIRRAFVPGLATGFLLLVHVRNVGLVIGLSILAARRLSSTRARIVTFAVGVALMAAFRTGLNYYLWGTFVTTPHARVAPWPGLAPFAAEIVQRGLGLLLDQEHGLLPYAPLYLLVPAGWLMMRRQRPEMAREMVVLVGVYLLFVLLPTVNPHGWRGGWSPAARFLLPVAPFLGLCAVFAVTQVSSRFPMGVIVALQALLDLFFWGHPMLLWNNGTGSAAFLQTLGGDTLVWFFPTWEPASGYTLVVSVLVIACWATLTAWIVKRQAVFRLTTP